MTDDQSKPIYLDNNATTEIDPRVWDYMGEVSRKAFANPGSRHSLGRVARQYLEESRDSIASIVGCKSKEIIFTSGGTESSNLAIFGLTATQEKGMIAITGGEHPATREPINILEKQGWKIFEIPLDESGLIDISNIDVWPWDEIRFVSFILAHNETGTIQSPETLMEYCFDRGIPVHVDAVQSFGKIDVNFAKLNATAMSAAAHKFHGPRGIGCLVLKENTAFSPNSFGGFQELGRRPGTELVALAAGMAKALELFQEEKDERTAYLKQLRDRLQNGLAKRCPPVVVNSHNAERLPNTLNIAFPGLDGDALLIALDLEGVCCSLGSACASGSTEPAPVLLAMKCTPEIYNASVRFSLSKSNTQQEIDTAIERISQVVASLREFT